MSVEEHIRDALLGRGVSLRSVLVDEIVRRTVPDLALFAERATDERVFEQLTLLSGSVSVAQAIATVSSGTTAFAVSELRSLRRVRSQPGAGSRVQFAGQFLAAGVADSLQLFGAFHLEDGLMVGYNGTQFGVFHRFDRALEIQALTITAGAAGAETATVTIGGAAHAVPLTLNPFPSISNAAFTASEVGAFGPYADTSGVLWEATAIGEEVIFIRSVAGVPPAGFSLLSTGAAAGTFAQAQAGDTGSQFFAAIGLPEETVTDHLESLDPLDGTGPSRIDFNPLLNNSYSIDAAQNGAVFSILDPDGKTYHPFYRATWLNTALSDSLFVRDPRLNIAARVESVGSTTDLGIAVSMMAGGVAGAVIDGPKWARTIEVVEVDTVEKTICTLMNAPTLYDTINRRRAQIQTLFVTNTGNKELIVRLRVNPILTNSHFERVDEDSIIIDGGIASSVSNGYLIRAVAVAPLSTTEFNLIENPIELDRNEVLAVTGQTSASTTGAICIMNGIEDI
jgi:hypothetical protein